MPKLLHFDTWKDSGDTTKVANEKKYDFSTAKYSRRDGGLSLAELNHVNRLADSLTLIADLKAFSQVREFRRLMRGYRKLVDQGTSQQWRLAADDLRNWAKAVAVSHQDFIRDGMRQLNTSTTIDTASGREEDEWT